MPLKRKAIFDEPRAEVHHEGRLAHDGRLAHLARLARLACHPACHPHPCFHRRQRSRTRVAEVSAMLCHQRGLCPASAHAADRCDISPPRLNFRYQYRQSMRSVSLAHSAARAVAVAHKMLATASSSPAALPADLATRCLDSILGQAHRPQRSACIITCT